MTASTGSWALRATTALLAAAAALVLAASALATRADPNVVKTLRQPDGMPISVRLWGDEFSHGYQTLDGYTLAYDAKGKTWNYAERDTRGRLEASKAVAKKDRPPGERNLRPTRAAIDEARAAKGAPPLGAPYLAAAPGWVGSDTDILFLVVEFTDTGCTFTPAQMQTNMFGGGASGRATSTTTSTRSRTATSSWLATSSATSLGPTASASRTTAPTTTPAPTTVTTRAENR
jgi:hypothetical protein